MLIRINSHVKIPLISLNSHIMWTRLNLIKLELQHNTPHLPSYYKMQLSKQLTLQFIEQRLDRIQALLRIVELQQVDLVHLGERQQVRQLIGQ